MRPPEVSIIVPTHDRPAGLKRCVAAVLAQSVREIELIVVDDHGSIPAADTLADVHDDRLTVHRLPRNAGPAAARNAGAALASAPLLAFTDDDCAPRPDWAARLIAAHREAPGRMVGGFTVNALTADPRAEASQRLIDCLYHRLNPNPRDASFLTSNNLLLAAADFERSGGFDADYPLPGGEDRAFCRTWKRQGGRITLVPDAIVDHYHALTLPRFLRQHYNYGRGSRQYHVNRSPAPATADSGRAGPGFVLRLISHPLREARSQSLSFRVHTASLLLLSQVATVAGTLAAPSKSNGAAK